MRLNLHHPDISGLFDPVSTYRRWVQIEQAAASAAGFDSLAYMLEDTHIDSSFIQLVEAIDAPTRINAFVQALECTLERHHIEALERKQQARFVHFGLSEQNLLDTDWAIVAQLVTSIIYDGARQLIRSLDSALDSLHGATRMGYINHRPVYPVPTALSIRTLRDEINRTARRLQQAAEEVPGSLAGPLGDHAFIDPTDVTAALSRLGYATIDWDASTTGMVARDRLVAWVQSMMNHAMALQKLAAFLLQELVYSQVEITHSADASMVIDSAIKARMYGKNIIDASTSDSWELTNRTEAEFIPLLCDRTALASLDMRQLIPDVTFIARNTHSSEPSAFHEMHRRIMNSPNLSRRTIERQIEEERR